LRTPVGRASRFYSRRRTFARTSLPVGGSSSFVCQAALRRCRWTRRRFASSLAGASGWWTSRCAAQVELVETLLTALAAADEFAPDRSDRARQANSLIVRIAEDYALSHADEHLYVSDLCRAAAVSERTLEYAFKEAMGLRPMAYLIRLRLHRVRQALLTGTPGSTTVSAEALHWGFWHFGEFSRAYKECFGELPSDTLRRKPGEPQR